MLYVCCMTTCNFLTAASLLIATTSFDQRLWSLSSTCTDSPRRRSIVSGGGTSSKHLRSTLDWRRVGTRPSTMWWTPPRWSTGTRWRASSLERPLNISSFYFLMMTLSSILTTGSSTQRPTPCPYGLIITDSLSVGGYSCFKAFWLTLWINIYTCPNILPCCHIEMFLPC